MPGLARDWNVERSDAMRGSTPLTPTPDALLTTNTFGTRPRLALHGHEDRV